MPGKLAEEQIAGIINPDEGCIASLGKILGIKCGDLQRLHFIAQGLIFPLNGFEVYFCGHDMRYVASEPRIKLISFHCALRRQ